MKLPRAGARAFEGVLESLLHRGADLEGVSDPLPAILGLRGSPLEAPENSITSLERALDLGQDGVAYDARACATGEIVLLRDATLDRTTDGRGALASATLPQVSTLDAGSWFGARFRGEPLALLEEALGAGGSAGAPRASLRSPRTVHMVWLRERGLVPEVARILAGQPGEVEVRLASESRETCLEIRDAGLAAVLVLDGASEEAREFVRSERIAACAMPPRSWREGAGKSEWSCERWSIGVDFPDELLLAFRSGQTGLATREPLRALSTRALVALAPEDRGPYPIHAPELSMGRGAPGESSGLAGTRGEWCGRWTCEGRVRNPFPFRVEVSVALVPRHGAFEAEGVPRRLELGPGEEGTVPFRLTGGSWRPGGDPLLSGLFRWKSAPGRKAGALLLDAPLVRTRAAFAQSQAVRLAMLRESPGDPPASMTLRRRGRQLYVSIENPGGLAEARTIVHVDGRFYRGGRGVRVLLPEDFDRRPGGIAFSCGIESRAGETPAIRRWAGGVPDTDSAGSPGRLHARA
ncbi:MAG: glycerophosphodiester phosphodiesterase [Planctomycetota bacterium]